jgi:hypothetical protein
MFNNNDKSQTDSSIHYNNSQNEVHSDIIGGDKVYGNVSASKGISFTKSVMNETQNGGQEKFDRLYRSVFMAIEKRPEDPQVKKSELHWIAESIYKELLHEGTASYPQIRLWLRQLNSLAPDVFQTCIAILTSPVSGLSVETVAVAEEVSRDCKPTAEMNMPINVYLENELTERKLSATQSQQMRVELEQLQQAVNEGNVRPIRQLLVDLTQGLPGMRQPLRSWLVETAGVPTAIKVFARNYLDQL